MPFGTENFTLKRRLKGGKERGVNRKREVRITKLVAFVCQGRKTLKGKESSLSPWPLQPVVPSKAGAISRARSPSFSVVPVKSKRVKSPKKSAKEEQPAVRTSQTPTPYDILVHRGHRLVSAVATSRLASARPASGPPDSPTFCVCLQAGLCLLFCAPRCPGRPLDCPRRCHPYL